MSLRLAGILLSLLVVYLAGNNAVSLWDRDEPRYAQASRQMLDSGDWTTPMLLDELRLKKPPLIYWCQATAMKLFGVTAGAARLPSVIATALTLVLIATALSRGSDARTALWTTLIYGTTGLTIAAAKMSITDATLTLFIVTAQICLYRLWIGRWCWMTVIGMGLSIGLAGLTKGPVVLGVLGMTALALFVFKFCFGGADIPVCHRVPGDCGGGDSLESCGRQECLPHRGMLVLKIGVILLLAAAVVAPWMIFLESEHPGAITSMLRSEVFNRIAKPQEGHTGPPGFYLLVVWGTFFPWSLLLPAAVVDGWKNRHDAKVRFALAAVIGPWVMFELIATKLPHYVLPTYAPLAYLIARVLLRSADGLTAELRQPHWPKVAAAWAGIVAIVALFPWLAVWAYGPLPAIAVIGSIAVSVWGALFAWRTVANFARHQPTRAAAWMGAGVLGVFLLCFTLVFPFSPYLRLSQRIAAMLPPNLAVGEAIMIDYKEPSLAFYQGGSIRPEPRNDFLATVDSTKWPNWIVTTTDVWTATPQASKDLLDIAGRIAGWGYADGNRRLELLILRKKRRNEQDG